jgi:hypothetical protein
LLRHGRPDVSLAFWGGLGDELLCTTPATEWLRRDAKKIWLSTRAPKLFEGFDSRVEILPDDPRYERLAGRLGRGFRFLSYATYDAATDRETAPNRHLIAEMCARAGLSGEVSLRPYLHLTATEIEAAAPWRDHVAIQASTLQAHVPMPNKQWPVRHFQAVVDRLGASVRFVQVGSKEDPPLRGVTNLCGQTSLRETAAVLFQARAFFGPVGFLMHLARASECPGVIVYGGRETPDLTGYPCNLNLTRTPSCSPCWQRARCDYGRICLEDLRPSDAIAALETMLARARDPLATTTVNL